MSASAGAMARRTFLGGVGGALSGAMGAVVSTGGGAWMLGGLAGCAPPPPPVKDARTPGASAAGALPVPARPADCPPPPGKKLRVLCVGAHPDDPESGCGGTLARYAEAGHDVAVIYVTRGDAGSETMKPEEMGQVRTREAEAACKVLGAHPVFFGQRTGDATVNRAVGDKFDALVKQLAPDLMFTHWPLDTNPDHQVASLLSTRAYLALRTPLPLYFYEVETGSETVGFHPSVFVDISSTQEKKLKALEQHVSQDPDRLYEKHHQAMERFRAREIAVYAAEAFVPFAPSLHEGLLPGL